MLAKQLQFLAGADSAGSCSARACRSSSPAAPITCDARLASAAVCALVANAQRAKSATGA